MERRVSPGSLASSWCFDRADYESFLSHLFILALPAFAAFYLAFFERYPGGDDRGGRSRDSKSYSREVSESGAGGNGVDETERDDWMVAPREMSVSNTDSNNLIKFLDGFPRPPGYSSYSARRPSRSLDIASVSSFHIIVVGAGIAGLTAAISLARRNHKVTILERSLVLDDDTTGVFLPPNCVRVLDKWTVALEGVANVSDGIVVRRWENGKVIGRVTTEGFDRDFGAPCLVVPSNKLLEALCRRAAQLGARVRYGCEVVGVGESDGRVKFEESGAESVVSGDLVVACDGSNSTCRNLLYGSMFEPRLIGSSMYRATIPLEKLKDDTELSWLATSTTQNIWIGHNRHITTHALSSSKVLEIILCHAEEADEKISSRQYSASRILEEYEGWDPVTQKLTRLVEDYSGWALTCSPILPSWTGQNSRLILLGDAAHAMPPHMHQGEAMAVEDSAALSIAISSATSVDKLPDIMQRFEKVRRKRTSQMQGAIIATAAVLHLGDGQEQADRDEAMKAEVEGRSFRRSPNLYSDPVMQGWAYGYDAEGEMLNVLEKYQLASSGE